MKSLNIHRLIVRWAAMTLIVLVALVIPLSAHAQEGQGEGGTTFGVESGSIFDIDPGSTIGINVNFTNNEDFFDSAIVSIIGPDGWNISWENQEMPSVGHEFDLPAGATEWAGYSIEAPSVSGGLPLSESLHQFSMKAQSLDNQSSDWYNFSLRYGFYDGASIVEGGGISSIEPGSTDIFEITLRNEGNSWRDLIMEIIPLDANSQPVGQSNLFFEYEGWSASIIDRWQLENVAPNGTVEARIQIDSPSEIDGSLLFKARVWSEASPGIISTTIQSVNIVPRVGGSIGVVSDGCSGIETIPGDDCEVTLEVTNTGDVVSSFELRMLGAEEWLNVDIENTHIDLESGQTLRGISVNVTIADGTSSGKAANVSIQLFVDDWSPGYISFGVVSGVLHAWVLEIATSEMIEENNLTSMWILTNSGNGPDGITANLDSNIVTEFSFVPPDGSTIDSISGGYRSFEILDVQPGGTVTFSAWMIVPDVAPVETQALMTIEVRSVRNPAIVFTSSDSVMIPGEEVIEPGTKKDSTGEIFIKWMNEWLEISLTIIVVVIGTIGVMKAISIRASERNSSKSDDVTKTERAEDWISRFQRGGVEESDLIESPLQPQSEFKRSFIEKSGGISEKPKTSPEEHVISKASEILDIAQTEDDINEAIRIADEISEVDDLHPDNEILDGAIEAGNNRKSSSEDEGPSGFDLEI